MEMAAAMTVITDVPGNDPTFQADPLTDEEAVAVATEDVPVKDTTFEFDNPLTDADAEDGDAVSDGDGDVVTANAGAGADAWC